MIRNEKVEVPVEEFENLLQALYFRQACELNNIEKWCNYENVLASMKEIAEKDIENGQC